MEVSIATKRVVAHRAPCQQNPLLISRARSVCHCHQLTSSAEWASGDRQAVAQWEYGVIPTTGTTPSAKFIHRRQNPSPTSSGIAYHKFYRQNQLLFSEVADQSEYGSWYWATDNVASLSHQSGSDIDVRGAFTSTGKLSNTEDTKFRPIQQSYPTFGFAVGLGAVTSTPISTLFTLGHAQEQAVQFNGAKGIVTLPTLWKRYYPTELDAVKIFLLYLGCS